MSLCTTFLTRRASALCSHDALRRKARMSARIIGCNRVERLAVDGECAALLASGEQAHDVLERCKELARALVRQRQAVPA